MCVLTISTADEITIIIRKGRCDRTWTWDITISTTDRRLSSWTAINITIPNTLKFKHSRRCSSKCDPSQASTNTRRSIRMEITEKSANISIRFRTATAAAKSSTEAARWEWREMWRVHKFQTWSHSNIIAGHSLRR